MTAPRAILCIDIDGTLIDSHEKVHPQDKLILQAFPKDIQPVMTTGRILHSAKGILQGNGLFTNPVFPLPGVFLNGGTAYLAEEKLCTQHIFPPQSRQSLIDLARHYPGTAFTFFTLGAVHLVNPNPFGQRISRVHHLYALETSLSDIPKEVIKVMILEEDQAILKRIEKESQGLKAEMAYSLAFTYEITPAGIDKANTLKTLLSAMQMENLPIYVTGDAQNDLTLFELAQESFAPETAHPSILERADHVIPREKTGLLAPILDHINL